MKSLKSNLLIALALGISFQACKKDPVTFEATVIDCNNFTNLNLSNLSGDDDIDYIINCHLEISSGNLNIAPGTSIVFGTEGSITIIDQASISAQGTASQPISLLAKQSNWGGIGIFSDNANNRIEYTTIDKAGAQSPWTVCLQRSAAVYVEGKLHFNNNIISNSFSDGLHLYECVSGHGSSLLSANNNRFESNQGYPIYAWANKVSQLNLSSFTFVANGLSYVAVAQPSAYAMLSTGSHTWQAPSIPFLLINGLDVNQNGSLTLEAGCDLAFESASTFTVVDNNASIRSNGTASQPVLIRGKQASAGYWQGLSCASMNAANILNYTNFSDGGLSSLTYAGNLKGNIYAGPWFEGRLTLNNCTSTRSNSNCDVVIGNANSSLTVTGTTLSSCNDY